MAVGDLVSADPVERVGSWKQRGRDSRSSVKRCFQEEKGGRWAGKQIRHLCHRGVRRGMCNPLRPAHSPALSEGLGGPGLDQGAPQGAQESFQDPRNRFRVLRRARQASDLAKLIEVEGHDFFSGSAAVAAGHLVSAAPVERVGPWKKRGRDSRSSVKRCFQEEKGGRWAGVQIRELRHR